MEEKPAYTESLISSIDRGLGRLTDVDKSPIQTALLKMNVTLNKLGDEVDRLSSRTAPARNLTPTEATEPDNKKEYGSALFAELTRMNNQSEQILRNLQNIINEIEL